MFSTTISGLNAFRDQLATISDNIANSETTAYKSGEVSFAEVLNSSTSAKSSTSIGNGVNIQTIAGNWTQGSISNTGNATDYALTGSGFFVVRDTAGVTSYTRDGQFSYNANGSLVNAEGMTVQGYAINAATGLPSNAYSDITISNAPLPGVATTTMTNTINLDSATASAGTYSATINNYDSLGNAIPLTLTFTKGAIANTWTWAATIPTADGTATGAGTLTFGTNGKLTGTTNPTISLALTNGATTPQVVTWNLYSGTPSATNGSLTQYAAESSLTNTSQNGIAPGQLKSVSTDDDGIITASYSNGETKAMFQLALADFNDYDGLNKTGNNLYRETPSSGAPIPGVAGSGKFGTLATGSLESSNVDMAQEMSNMIVAQRSYESCARMFTTESEMLSTTVNMGK
jgi:flagellar hook protein FlgE